MDLDDGNFFKFLACSNTWLGESVNGKKIASDL